MFSGGGTLTLFRVRGIRIAVDWSWFLVLFLVIFWLSDFYGDVLDKPSGSTEPYLLAVASARRRGDRRDQAIRWMSLLVLAAMQSPFSPAYSTFALLWATTLLSVEVQRTRDAVALIALWPAILYGGQGLDPLAQATLSIAQTALIVGVSAWLVVRPARGDQVA